MIETTLTRDQITELLRDNLLVGIDFDEGTTDTVKIEIRQNEGEEWKRYSLHGKDVFEPNEALTILVSLYEEGFALRAEMTANLSGDWDEEIDQESQES